MSEQTTIEKVMEAVTELRSEVEKKSPDPEKIEKLNKRIDGWEEFQQKYLRDLKNSEKIEKDLKERIDGLEVNLALSAKKINPNHYKEMPEYKALETFIKQGKDGLEQEQKAVLRTDVDTAGGFLIQRELDARITKKIVEISNVRGSARVRTIGVKTLEIAVRNGIPTSTFEGEAESGDDSQSDYTNEGITAFRQTFTTGITVDSLMNSGFDMESELMTDAGEAFAEGEGMNFVNGDGFKKPKGFIVDTRVTDNARTTEQAGQISFNDTMLLTGDLKTGYNPEYFFNRRTLAQLRIIKGGDGHPVWQPGMNGVVANTINGFNYVILNDMPDIASNAIPIAFADLNKGYLIIDRTGMVIIRDELNLKRQAIVEFTFRRWLTGQVVLPEAIKVLKVAA